MTRLISVTRLVSDVTRVGGKKSGIAASLNYLAARRSDLAAYSTVEDLVLADPTSDPLAASFIHHLTRVRAELVTRLWAKEIFVGVSVVDDLLFGYARDPSVTDPLRASVEFLRDRGVTQPGLLVFPLHSFGILGAGLWQFATGGAIAFSQPSWGLAVLPQSNDMAKTHARLSEVATGFGVRQQLPRDLIDHWRRSRPTKWLERNPLLVLRTVNVSGDYYENEHLLMRKVEAYTGLIALLASLQGAEGDTDKRFASSSMLNNTQTLDLHHYLTFFPIGRRKTLDGYCVHMNLGRPDIVDLSDLRVELDPSFWTRRQRLAGDAHVAVQAVLAGYLEHSLLSSRQGARARTFRKLMESLIFFRRSFRRTGSHWSGVVSLATAFEMLLTDHYARGVEDRLVRRSRILLSGTRGTTTLQASVRELYHQRSNVVHAGKADPSFDLAAAREAYARIFIALSRRLPNLTDTTATPIGDLTGDFAPPSA